MNALLCIPERASALTKVEEWLESLSAYRGLLATDDPLMKGRGGGWRISTLGREIAVVVDNAFPFSKPQVYLRGERDAMPHVEHDGRICLKNPATPSDPIGAVSGAIFSARELLRATDDGSEDGDFYEDFGLYWLQSASSEKASLLLTDSRCSGRIWWTATASSHIGFSSPGTLKRWWHHRYHSMPRKIRQGAYLVVDELPHPSRYPSNGADLWELIATQSKDGLAVLSELLTATPKALLVVLSGAAPSGRRHQVALLLERPKDTAGRPAHRRQIEPYHPRRGSTPEDLCGRHTLTRLTVEFLDAAKTRVPYEDLETLSGAKVAIIGCGALGSGIARLLAKSGVGHLTLVDHEVLGWENIRRHALGADAVGRSKATALAAMISQAHPEIGSAMAIVSKIEPLLLEQPSALQNMDLVISCTAIWSANVVVDRWSGQTKIPVVYGWLETHALAAHAVLVPTGWSYIDGFDHAGNPRLAASGSNKPIPTECGASTSPYGALELSQAETLVSRLVLDVLRGKAHDATWRTWLADDDTREEAEGYWTDEWIRERGHPKSTGEITAADWWIS